MSVSGISAAASNTGLLKLFQQRSQELMALESAVQSGDISTAQNALAALEPGAQDDQSPAGSSNDSAAQSADSSGSNSFASDLTALLQAVQSGNLADAQQAATAIQNNLQNAAQQAPGAAHNHRHHHHQAPSADPTGTNGSASTSTTSAVATAPDDAILLMQAYYLSN